MKDLYIDVKIVKHLILIIILHGIHGINMVSHDGLLLPYIVYYPEYKIIMEYIFLEIRN